MTSPAPAVSDQPQVPVRRLEYLLEPGEGVITTGSLFTFLERMMVFREDTELSDDDIVETPVVSVPLPAVEFDGDQRVRPKAHAEMLWFPMFWLPRDIGLRRQVPADPEVPGSEERTESDEEWAVRVMLQATAAGLFEPLSGTWLDVLSYAGLDGDEDDTIARIERWQSGEADSVLDHIDLSPLFDAAGAEDIAESIYGAIGEYQGAQYALSAFDVGSNIDSALEEPSVQENPEAVAGVFRYWASLAVVGFAGNPSSERYENIQARVNAMLEQAVLAQEDGASDPSPELIADLREICEDVYATFQPFLETVGEAAAETVQFESDEDAAPSEELPEDQAPDNPPAVAGDVTSEDPWGLR